MGRLLTMLRRPSGGYDLTKWNSVHNTALRTGSTTILLPFSASTGNRTIDWGDGVVEVVNTANPSHEYASNGVYTVTVSGGTTTQLGASLNAGWQQTVTEVISWGNLGWTLFDSGFRGCTQNVKVPSSIPTTVTSINDMFRSATTFNQNITQWNTSNITTMSFVFLDARAFNQNISTWNVSVVSTLRGFISGATAFNQDLGAWQLRTAGINITEMLNNSGLSVENYSRTLIGWANYVSANSNTPATVTLNATGRKYNTTAYTTGLTYNDGAAARAYLVGVPPGWTITDAGQE